ncbi:uncharacterized protein LOC143684797 isoform X3 [Tamandua tetradactyla]|uniref:uncharacterized protein LOC143684797 isoform X3 n=1 Tax=Tamandua tetradactyla TaxID=48850 RepID=UPI0040547778
MRMHPARNLSAETGAGKARPGKGANFPRGRLQSKERYLEKTWETHYWVIRNVPTPPPAQLYAPQPERRTVPLLSCCHHCISDLWFFKPVCGKHEF